MVEGEGNPLHTSWRRRRECILRAQNPGVGRCPGPLGNTGIRKWEADGRQAVSIHSSLPSPPPPQAYPFCLPFASCNLQARFLARAVPTPPPTLAPSHCAHSSRERSENLAEWVSCTCLVPLTVPGEQSRARLTPGSPSGGACGMWVSASSSLRFRTLSAGWDHRPPPALGQERKH